ncbi:MAG: sigma 54-interacting transcriptional regulator [Desulfoferrobacter sp.]
MYQLLDLRNCQDEIRVSPEDPYAILDTEYATIAAITGNGRLICCNRAFLLKYNVDYKGGCYLTIREALPSLWELFRRPPPRGGEKTVRIINLRLDSSAKPLGHLLVSFEKDSPGRNKIDLHTIVSVDNHPDFINSYAGLYVANPEAYTVKVNPAYEKIAFLPESDLVGRNLKELVEKGYFSRSVTLSVLDRLKHQGSGEVTFPQKIISGKEVLVTGTPIYTRQKKLDYILTFVHDLLPLEMIAQKCLEHEQQMSAVWLGAELSQSAKVDAARNESRCVLPKFDSLPIVAKAPLSISTLKQVVCAARYEAPILLTGETGVGKDLMAKYIHLLQRGGKNQPFIPVNCSAIPGELLESELFGYEEGAFSGARKGGKTGLFAAANEGILFLNEISEMPLGLQAKLLTALDEGCIRPLGSSRTKQIKARIICATNKDLCECIEQGAFRSDLYYRIKVLTVHISPLRERRQDILPLVYHFMARLSAEFGLKKFLSPEVQEILLKYSWPGNVRELRNLVERLLVFSSTSYISVCELPPEISSNRSEVYTTEGIGLNDGETLKKAMRKYERHLINEALKKYGKPSDAARILGIDPTTLVRKLKRRP